MHRILKLKCPFYYDNGLCSNANLKMNDDRLPVCNPREYYCKQYADSTFYQFLFKSEHVQIIIESDTEDFS